MDKLLIIQFAKWPRLGKVKTRLAQTIGNQAAFDVHVELTMNVLANLTSANLGTVELWFDQILNGEEGRQLMALCDKTQVTVSTQCGVDLGERMYQALSKGLRNHDKVIIVGSDCPTVDEIYLMSAVSALDSSDLVLGPAEDGGYVLIGARKIHSELFAGIEWGTSSVLEATSENAKKNRLSVKHLALTWDVDEYEDYLRWSDEG